MSKTHYALKYIKFKEPYEINQLSVLPLNI